MATRKTALSVPRYDNFRPRSSQASRVGASNRRQDTTPEILLRKALWAAGVRYRLHPPALIGRPDLVIARHRVVVFCDGDFWHGRKWSKRKGKLAEGWNASYWVAKIERNRQRDRQVARVLRALGWTVVRVWESDVRRDPAAAASKILGAIEATSPTRQR
jgi:DNA mismatch endonuclease (patch repair protein)